MAGWTPAPYRGGLSVYPLLVPPRARACCSSPEDRLQAAGPACLEPLSVRRRHPRDLGLAPPVRGILGFTQPR